MQNLICKVPVHSKTSSSKRERIVWEKEDGDDKTKKILIRTSNSDRIHSRSVQVIQEEKSARSYNQIQSSQKIEVFFNFFDLNFLFRWLLLSKISHI